MILDNIRFGFACNSSSSHSMIFKRPNDVIMDEIDDDYFGWSFFTLVSTKSKKEYLAAILLQHFSRIIGNDNALDIVEKWLDINLRNNLLFSDVDWCASVEHQSVPELPHNWNGQGYNREFFEEYKEFILQDNLVILGGNDNDPEIHPLLERSSYIPFVLPLLYDKCGNKLVARKDPSGYWTLFDRLDGTKIRAFLDNEKHPKIEKSHAPELVDIKITDFCGKKCGFCYQDSSVEGKHGDLNYIRNVLNVLSKLKVFEIAIGGGEPTEHPNFQSIIEWCYWNNIVPNFTTKSLKWLENSKIRESVIKYVGSFAYSVTSPKDLIEFCDTIKKYDLRKIHPSVQIILGLVDEKALRSIIVLCYLHHLSITILGYKETGRGRDFKNKRILYQFDWIGVIKEMRNLGYYVNISIDTMVAKTYEKELNQEGVDPLFYTTEEGKFSCYIDAVSKKISSSSFSDTVYDLIDVSKDIILRKYASF